ncbi:MAG: OsmC family protein [Bacteroidia bacterium]|nr:OsmC family protein [Bacteroidia bacterium]
MFHYGKQKIRTALPHHDLMQILHDELIAEKSQLMSTIHYLANGQTNADHSFTVTAGQYTVTTSLSAGSKTHPDPNELLLAAYAASFAQLLYLVAEEQLIELKQVHVKAGGELNPAWFLGLSKTDRAGLQKIQLTVRLSSNASPEELVNLLQTARNRSPVADNLINPTPTAFTLDLQEDICRLKAEYALEG